MDAELIRTYAVSMIHIAQSAKGVTDAELAKRLQRLGAEVSGRTLRRQIATGDLSAVLFLQCMVALEIEGFETDAMVGFVQALSCPSCAPFMRLPELRIAHPIDEPIPF